MTPDASLSPQLPELAQLSPSQLTLRLTRLGLQAPDLGSAMQPMLEALVVCTGAAGAGYFQWRDATLAYHARAAAGEMPAGPAMEAILAHGLPGHLPLIGALSTAEDTLFIGDTRQEAVAGHTDRVTRLAERLGERLGLDFDERRELRWGAYLHDLGKISLPDEILLYEGPLTAALRRQMQGHVQEGVRLAGQLPFLPQSVLDVIGAHHERWDGAGYPLGLRGEEIPLPARIFAICDVYDALSSARPYKKAWERADTLAYLRAVSGEQFDPQVVTALLDLLDGEG